MHSKLLHSFYIFTQFFRRDLYVYGKQLNRFIINYVLIYPTIYAICFAFLQAKNYFGDNAKEMGTLSFAGVILLVMASVSYRSTFDVFFDLIENRHISFRVTLLNPCFIVLEHFIFASVFTFILSAPFYLVSRILVGHIFDMSHIHWPSLFTILALGCMCCVSYHLLAAVTLKRVEQIGTFWFRVNFVLLVFGGTWIPHYVISSVIPSLGYVTYLAPLTYVTEGLRQAIVGGPRFLPISTCMVALTAFTTLFIALTFRALKKRIDHI